MRMVDILQYSSLDLATIAGIVAALVAVVGNTFKIPLKYRALLAILFSLVFVFMPGSLLNHIITAVVIGLTASGVYSHVKPDKLDTGANGNNNDKSKHSINKKDTKDNTENDDRDLQ